MEDDNKLLVQLLQRDEQMLFRWVRESVAFYKEVRFLSEPKFEEQLLQYLRSLKETEQSAKTFFLFKLDHGATEEELYRIIKFLMEKEYEGRIFSEAVSKQKAKLQ